MAIPVIPIIDNLFEMGKSIIQSKFPDPVKQAEELRKLEELRQKGDIEKMNIALEHAKLGNSIDLAVLENLNAQIKVNIEQAKSKSFFVAGARPAAIWAGVLSMSWAGMIHPMLTWVWAFAEMAGNPPPIIESTALATIAGTLLGVGGYRSYEKMKGVQTDRIRE